MEPISIKHIHSRKLTWKPKKGPIKTTVLLKGDYMGFHVSLGECIGHMELQLIYFMKILITLSGTNNPGVHEPFKIVLNARREGLLCWSATTVLRVFSVQGLRG